MNMIIPHLREALLMNMRKRYDDSHLKGCWYFRLIPSSVNSLLRHTNMCFVCVCYLFNECGSSFCLYSHTFLLLVDQYLCGAQAGRQQASWDRERRTGKKFEFKFRWTISFCSNMSPLFNVLLTALCANKHKSFGLLLFLTAEATVVCKTLVQTNTVLMFCFVKKQKNNLL